MSECESAVDDLIVVSNSEPFTHTYDGDDIEVASPAGGLTSALNETAGSRGWTWVAWGRGEADFDSRIVSKSNTVRDEWIPESYTLDRVQLSDAQVNGYYYGYSNQVLWPLCHLELSHVNLNKSDWEVYQQVNRQFATRVASHDENRVWIHDYHLTLLPKYLREKQGDADTLSLVHFWHIPWPPTEVFRVSPHHEEILRGLLANDAIGFHTDHYRQRFFECVEELLDGVQVEKHQNSIWIDGTQTEVFVTPIGINVDSIQSIASRRAAENQEFVQEKFGIEEPHTLSVGVDRLDYSKGIIERLDALERAFSVNSGLQGDLVYLQIASKSRSKIPSYRRYHRAVLERVDEVNDRFSTADWQPVIYTDEAFTREELIQILQRADIGLISARRDGLNLVAEEFVAASQSHPSEILLSEFAGVAEILSPPVTTINPFDTAGFADAILEATKTTAQERRTKMQNATAKLREQSLQQWINQNLRLFDSFA